ncbi:trypsin-like peptidase domain-containing protein [Thermomicrobium sp. 4228-Ro]|uniref:S1C family serine protease n=1 Tax=Thermomicrobium sp. 4228-Ro TaxID=2993937 RepID=UPI00224906F3|nr:trypsin-like peptidase domain-containing protein [Thermomicrobium sp. 4228-Ro]MCX2728323.1 trypsin-like peptidase domain-containing protein [Thermomicrobium sp. 4228-Ro]
MRHQILGLTALIAFFVGWIAGSGCFNVSVAPSSPSPTGALTPVQTAAALSPLAQADRTPAGTTVTAPAPAAETNFATAIETVAQQVTPAVVYVAVRSIVPSLFGFGQIQQGVGSGVIFDARGYILTNDHVIAGAQEIQVVLGDGRQFTGRVVGRSPANDIAVVKIDGENLPVATLGDSDQLRVGQWVVAIGNALGLEGGPTVTAGVVSALNRTITPSPGEAAFGPLIQTDAAINPGNSGGPLVNLQGEVVGINTAKIQTAEGIGFAIPINKAKEIVQQLLEARPRPYLGITSVSVTPALAAAYGLPVSRGVLVVDVESGGPADQAGIQPGDIIVRLDDREIANGDDLQAALGIHQPGDEVTLVVNRNGREISLRVTLGTAPVIQ